mgnify:CR=1 FL=1
MEKALKKHAPIFVLPTFLAFVIGFIIPFAQGFYLSLGEYYPDETMKMIPDDRLFLETDESSVPVADLYSRAAEVRRVSLAELTEAIRENIAKVFFKQ